MPDDLDRVLDLLEHLDERVATLEARSVEKGDPANGVRKASQVRKASADRTVRPASQGRKGRLDLRASQGSQERPVLPAQRASRAVTGEMLPISSSCTGTSSSKSHRSSRRPSRPRYSHRTTVVGRSRPRLPAR